MLWVYGFFFFFQWIEYIFMDYVVVIYKYFQYNKKF